MKAVVMLSGGLDSILAAKILQEQHIELVALNFLTVFCTCTTKNHSCLASSAAAQQLGIKLEVMEVSDEYLKIVQNPRYGYGSNLNPCIDCRIFIFRKAKEYMEKIGASFIVTGEVLGERPMSQRLAAMRLIEKESGLEGLILRPLSAKLLSPTTAELNGWVDRERLFSIHGRSRKPQMKLVQHYNIKDYPCPSGGCLLTDPTFSRKLRNLIDYGKFNVREIRFLKSGRYFYFDGFSLSIGRNEEENKKLLNLVKAGEFIFEPQDIRGPVGIGRGMMDERVKLKAASIIARYTDRNREIKVKVRVHTKEEGEILNIRSIDEKELEKYRC